MDVAAQKACLTCVAPLDNKDGSYTLPAPIAAGTSYFLVRTGAVQRQVGPQPQYTLQGTRITLSTPLSDDEWIEFYYTKTRPAVEGGFARTSFQVLQ